MAAKESSVAEILKYSAETAEVFLHLIKSRAVLLDHKKAIEIYQETIGFANAEKNRILSMMKEFNLQGRSDQATFKYLNKTYDTQENIVKYNSKYLEKEKLTLEPLHTEFSKKCISEHSCLLSLIPPMTIALRRELENDGDSEIFVNALNENIARMNNAYDKLFAEIEA